MGINFGKLTKKPAAQTATEPRRIFTALAGRDAKYSYPRDVQSEVWTAWHDRRDESDLVVKMNTGGGKTVVGLLMLRSSLNEGVGSAAYITPDPYLTEQVAKEARQLGIETVDDPESPRFRSGQAILIANIYKLFNGLSRFGVKGSYRRTPIDLGAIVIDDAHACLATVQEQFALQIPDGHDAYQPLRDLFADELRRQSKPTYDDLADGDRSAVMEVPYWAWADRQEKVVDILRAHRDTDELRFNWALIADCLDCCRVAISADSIEIAPPCPPVDQLPSFVRAKRRIYLTATLADDSILVTHFAADPDSVSRPITPSSADDIGDRMILTPLETFVNADDEAIRAFAAQEAATINVVVIVPSHRRAALWQDIAAATHTAKTLHTGLDELRAGHVGLVVLINKYDGIDLPDDACRILILDGLPEAQGPLARLEAVALDGSDASLTRQVQRIEQGMGRGVRSNKDYCVVLLVGRRLTARLYPQTARQKFSPATRAQLDLSDAIAGELVGRRLVELGPVVAQCLNRDQAWVEASRDALDGLRYAARGSISQLSLAQREAFELAQQRRYGDAAARIQQALGGCTDPQLRGLLKQQAAAYLHRVDPVGAQRLQLSAVGDNRSLIKPTAGISYVPLKSAGQQAAASAGHLSGRFSMAAELTVGVRSLLEDLEPDPDQQAVNRFEQAVCDLGLLLGFQAERPERDLGNGPDVLWMIGDLKYVVIECKSGATTHSISRHDIAQLAQSVDWFEQHYGRDRHVTPLMIHPSRQLHAKATARQGTRIMTFEKLADLRHAVEQYAIAVAANDRYHDADEVAKRLSPVNLTGAAIIGHFTQTSKGVRKG